MAIQPLPPLPLVRQNGVILPQLLPSPQLNPDFFIAHVHIDKKQSG